MRRDAVRSHLLDEGWDEVEERRVGGRLLDDWQMADEEPKRRRDLLGLQVAREGAFTL